MSRPDLPAAVAAAIAGGARWLLTAIGTAMGAPAPACTSRSDALRRATAAVSARGGGQHGWVYTDAVQVGNRWMCVIEDEVSVYLVEVAVHSGVARVLTEVRKEVSVEGAPAAFDAAADGAAGRRATRFWLGGPAGLPRPGTARRRAAVRRPQPAPRSPRRPQTPR